MSALDVWSRVIVDNRSLPRSGWQYLGAIKKYQNLSAEVFDAAPGREIIYPGILQPQLVDSIDYDQTDFLQEHHHIAICWRMCKRILQPFAMSSMNTEQTLFFDCDLN